MTGRKIGIVLICLLECAILSFAFIHPVRIYSGGAVSGRAVQESEPDGAPFTTGRSGGIFTQIDLSCNELTVFRLLRKGSPSGSKEPVDEYLAIVAAFGLASVFAMRCRRRGDKPVFACDLNGIIEFLHNKDGMK
jgi:hypothetical protein